MKLTRRFSPFSIFVLNVNGIIGSAWLFAPLYAAKIAGPAVIISWVIGGLAASLIALTFAEIATLIPVAGSTAHIPQLSHGTLVSIILSWISWLSLLMLAPVEVQAVLQYASLFFPSLTHLSAEGVPVLTGFGLMWAALLMFLLCFINVASFKGLVRFNNALFIFKVSVILLTIVALCNAQFHATNFAPIFSSPSNHNWPAILSAVAGGGIAFAFNGFKNGVEMAGETKNAALAIPVSIVGSVLCCLLIYLGLQVSFIGAVHPSMVEKGWHSISFVGEIGPFVGIAAGLSLFWLLKLLYANAVVSPMGAGLAYVTTTSRLLFAMSQIGFVPKFISKINDKGFPMMATMVNFVLGMFLFLPLPGWQAMVNFIVSAIVVSYAVGPITLLCLRQGIPDEKRPFRLPAARLTCLLAFYCCNLFCYWTGWDTMSKFGIAVGIGLGLMFIGYLRGMLKVTPAEVKSSIWIIVYLAGLVLLSYLGSFGGRNIITFGWDFLVIAVFTAAILYLSVVTRLDFRANYMKNYRDTGLAAAAANA